MPLVRAPGRPAEPRPASQETYLEITLSGARGAPRKRRNRSGDTSLRRVFPVQIAIRPPLGANRGNTMTTKRALRPLLLSTLLASAPALVAAQSTEVTDLDAITITASSQPVNVSQTGATVDVITAEQTEAAPLSFANFLSGLPGVTLSANGGLGTITALRVRGLPAYYLGTRIDGLDVTDPSGTQLSYDFGGLTTGGLSRIEVLRGSQSALYGSEAVAGVVDVTTWRPETDGVSGQTTVEGGAFGTWSATASTGLRNESTELSLTATHTESQGISAHVNGTEKDGFTGTQVSAYGRHALNDWLAIGASVLSQDSQAEFDASTGDADNLSDGQLRGGRLFAQFNYGAVSHELSYARMKSKRDLYEWGGHTYFDGARETLGYDGRWTITPALALNWGLEHKTEDFSVVSSWSSTINGVETNSAYAEALWSPNADLDLSLALRHDDHSLFGGQNSARAALAWRPSSDWIVRGVASSGYRAPSPYELWSSYGDPSFTPEKSRSLEFGVERLLAGGSVRATLFDTRVKDQVVFDSNSFVYTQVDGTTKSRGVELSGEMELNPNWKLFGAYTYSEVSITDAGVERRGVRAPRHNLTLGVDGQINERLGARLSATHVADLWDEYVDYSSFPYATVQQKLADYTLINASLTYELTDKAQAYLRVENLFDQDYQTVLNYAQPGRAVYVGVSSKW